MRNRVCIAVWEEVMYMMIFQDGVWKSVGNPSKLNF